MLRLVGPLIAIAVLASCGTHAISGSGKPAPNIATPPAKPAPPDLIHENSDQGAQATAGYWLVLLDYALVTGDDEVLLESGTQDCQTCLKTAEHIREIYGSGSIITGELSSPLGSTVDYSEKNLRVVTVALEETELTKIDKAGSRSIYNEAKTNRYQLKLVWTKDQWKVAQTAYVAN